MRLQILLPKVNVEQITPPSKCVDPACQGKKFRLHQPVKKALRDTVYHEVQAYRYQCLKCQRTFRVYPQGVTAAQTSLRVKGLAVMLYLLGGSYGATSLALEALGVSMCRSRVYDAVQEAASRVPGRQQRTSLPGAAYPSIRGRSDDGQMERAVAAFGHQCRCHQRAGLND